MDAPRPDAVFATDSMLVAAPEMLAVLREIVLSADDGPSGIAGLDSGGTLCIKGSFLTYIERARAVIAKAEMPPEADRVLSDPWYHDDKRRKRPAWAKL